MRQRRLCELPLREKGDAALFGLQRRGGRGLRLSFLQSNKIRLLWFSNDRKSRAEDFKAWMTLEHLGRLGDATKTARPRHTTG